VAAWRVGRLRAALPALARDLIEVADAELAGIGPLDQLGDDALVRLLSGARDRLIALHGHEILMGWLVADGVTATTGASVALRLLAQGRRAGWDDATVVARHPTVLALTAPRVGPAPVLPPTAGPVTAPAVKDAEDGAAILREALRLRTRWVQELSARAAWELGRRLASRSALDRAESVRWLRLAELSAAVTARTVPADLAVRAHARVATPLPARFRLAADGSPVAETAASAGSSGRGRGAGGGRGAGPVHSGAGAPPEGSVLVVPSLDPGLAPWLPRLAGLVAETGSPLSHLAILAREYRVPVAVGVVGALDRFAPGTSVLVDGATGEVTPVELHEGAA
jgi:phosphohistidine swiveling domain-containing protein